jgi:hypothetical protein
LGTVPREGLVALLVRRGATMRDRVRPFAMLVCVQVLLALLVRLWSLIGLGDHWFPPGTDATTDYHAVCTQCENQAWPSRWRDHDPPRCELHGAMILCENCLRIRYGL